MTSNAIADHVGFGCASLFALPSAAGRRTVLEQAYDLGIRHFDVAPIYGLGRAEVELAHLRRQHPDVQVATKFGLTLTPLGRVAGLVQRPVRAVLARRPGLKNQVKESGKGPDAGQVGGALYRSGEYSVTEAAAALQRARRVLGVERIDAFLAHEPALVMQSPDALIDFLAEQQRQGAISSWGPAGELPIGEPASTAFYRAAPLVQRPYALGDVDTVSIPADTRQVLFGFLSGTLPALRDALATDAELRERCTDVLGHPLAEADLPGVLLRDAIRASGGGRVLVSTTNPRHLRALSDAATTPAAPEEPALCKVLQTAIAHTSLDGGAA